MSSLREQMANLINQPQTPPPASASEERPLLRSFPNPSRYGPQIPIIRTQESSLLTWLQNHLTADISIRWAELQLIVSFFVSGMIDAGAYNAYECFCSMQVRSFPSATHISFAKHSINTLARPATPSSPPSAYLTYLSPHQNSHGQNPSSPFSPSY
jgi:hypothetical protein